MIVRSESTTSPTPLVVVAAANAFGQLEHVAPRVAEEREPGADVLDAVLAAVSDDSASGEDALNVLVRRVLLAALELREGRRSHEEVQRAT
jgi:hypothetical protein